MAGDGREVNFKREWTCVEWYRMHVYPTWAALDGCSGLQHGRWWEARGLRECSRYGERNGSGKDGFRHAASSSVGQGCI